MEKELIIEKLIYLKKLIGKAEKIIEKYWIMKEEEKDVFFAAASKFVEEIIETTIKINNMLLKEKKEYASTYYQSFIKISELFNINKEDIKEIASLATIRNKITYEYDTFLENEDKNMKIYQEFLEKIPKYIQIIKDILSNY